MGSLTHKLNTSTNAKDIPRVQAIKTKAPTMEITIRFIVYVFLWQLLKTHTYQEVGNMYGITHKTVIDRLKKLKLYKPNGDY